MGHDPAEPGRKRFVVRHADKLLCERDIGIVDLRGASNDVDGGVRVGVFNDGFAMPLHLWRGVLRHDNDLAADHGRSVFILGIVRNLGGLLQMLL